MRSSTTASPRCSSSSAILSRWRSPESSGIWQWKRVITAPCCSRVYSERYGNSACALTEEDLEEMIEVPRLEDGDIFANEKKKQSLSPRERALQVALTAEQSARQFYASIAEKAVDPVMRRFYRELSEFEEGHVQFLERKLAEAATTENNGGNTIV